MPSVTPQTFQPEETLNLIAERAKVLAESGQPPVFDVNVSRKNPQTGIPNQIASFSNATLEHITEPLRWLPMLCGGGEYVLNVRHPSVQGRIGGPILTIIDKTAPGMEPRAVNPNVTKLPTWMGPQFTGPWPDLPPQQPPAGATVHGNGFQTTAGYGIPQLPPPQPQQVTPADRERELTQQLADLKAHAARIEAEAKATASLEAERRSNEARLREVQQQAENARRDLEQRTAAQIAELRASQVKPDPAGGWEKLIAVVMPLVQQMMTAQHETRVMMMKMNEDQNRRQLEAAEKQHQAQMELMRAVTAKPAGMSEEMRLLIEQLRADKKDGGNDAAAAMMTRMVEAMGMVSKTSMGMIETIADIQMGDSEHPMVGAIREAVSAMKLLMAGSKEGAQRVVQKQIPAGQRQLTPQQQAALRAEQQRQAQHAANQRAAQQAAAAQAGKQTPPKPPAPQPQPVPVTTFVPPAAAPQPQPAPVAEPAHSHFEILKAGVAAFKPPEEVADYFIQLVKADEPSLEAELNKHGGSPFALLQAEFGQPFIAANAAYFAELGTALDKKGIAEGLWTEDDDDEGDDVDDDGPDDAPPPPTLVAVPDLEATIPLDAAPAAPVPESAAVVVAPKTE